MNKLQRIAAASVLATVPLFGAGCSGGQPSEYRLNHIGTIHVFNMAVFAENNDNTLNLEQAENYVKAEIFKDPNEPTREELEKIIQVAAYVRNVGSQENLQITSRNLLAVHNKYITELCHKK